MDQAKGVEVTANDLMKVRDFLLAHREELQNGELSEDALLEVSGGSADTAANVLTGVIGGTALFFTIAGLIAISW